MGAERGAKREREQEEEETVESGERLADEVESMDGEEPDEGAPGQSWRGDPSAGASGPGGS